VPFRNAQAILKRVLPQKTFDGLYDAACNTYDVCRKVLDNTIWIPQLVYYGAKGDEYNIAKTLLVQKVISHTMVSKVGVQQTFDVTAKAIEEDVFGVFVECGVARGGCSALMALLADRYDKSRDTYLFDSFEGLPMQTDKDGEQKPIRHKDRKYNDLATGYCLGTLGEVDDWLFNRLKLNRARVFMIKGWFQDTLPLYKKKIGKIAVLRLDGDWYESTKCCLDNLYENVIKGGFVIIDDYQLVGCKKAVDEFITNNNLNVSINNDVNGRAYWVK
jgi:O-methyltransferase